MRNNPLKTGMKGQTTAVMIVLVVIIFGGLVLFLLSFARVLAPSPEYENLYVHNLLVTTLNTDTGYLESDCKTMSDLFMCAFTTNIVCGDSGQRCLDILDELLPYYLDKFEEERPGHSYLFVAEPGTPNWRPLDPNTGRPMRIVIGNESLEDAKIEKLSANERIQKGGNILNVQVLTAKR